MPEELKPLVQKIEVVRTRFLHGVSKKGRDFYVVSVERYSKRKEDYVLLTRKFLDDNEVDCCFDNNIKFEELEQEAE